MSMDLFEEKKDSIEKIEKSEPEINEKEKLVQYINYPSDLNLVSLKTRFACKKILDLLDNSKEEDLTWEDLNDPTKAKINKEKLDRKIIQFYCMENIEKNKFASPSEKTMNKIQQFKRWQKYEMFKKNGIKNYLNNILPDYRIVHRTKDYVKNNLNLYTKLKIKKNPETIILPNLENQHYYNNRNLKESEFLNNQSQSMLPVTMRPPAYSGCATITEPVAPFFISETSFLTSLSSATNSYSDCNKSRISLDCMSSRLKCTKGSKA